MSRPFSAAASVGMEEECEIKERTETAALRESLLLYTTSRRWPRRRRPTAPFSPKRSVCARVKKTVNFDAPDVYHLYYGDEVGAPGSVMTYFPFPDIAQGRPGTGEVGETVFSVPEG